MVQNPAAGILIKSGRRELILKETNRSTESFKSKIVFKITLT